MKQCAACSSSNALRKSESYSTEKEKSDTTTNMFIAHYMYLKFMIMCKFLTYNLNFSMAFRTFLNLATYNSNKMLVVFSKKFCYDSLQCNRMSITRPEQT